MWFHLARNLWPKSFKNSPIWSHCFLPNFFRVRLYVQTLARIFWPFRPSFTEHSLPTLIISVNRFGEISPFGQIKWMVWQYFEGLFSIWDNFGQILDTLGEYSSSWIAILWKNKFTIWSHCWVIVLNCFQNSDHRIFTMHKPLELLPSKGT